MVFAPHRFFDDDIDSDSEDMVNSVVLTKETSCVMNYSYYESYIASHFASGNDESPTYDELLADQDQWIPDVEWDSVDHRLRSVTSGNSGSSGDSDYSVDSDSDNDMAVDMNVAPQPPPGPPPPPTRRRPCRVVVTGGHDGINVSVPNFVSVVGVETAADNDLLVTLEAADGSMLTADDVTIEIVSPWQGSQDVIIVTSYVQSNTNEHDEEPHSKKPKVSHQDF